MGDNDDKKMKDDCRKIFCCALKKMGATSLDCTDPDGLKKVKIGDVFGAGNFKSEWDTFILTLVDVIKNPPEGCPKLQVTYVGDQVPDVADTNTVEELFEKIVEFFQFDV